MLAAVVAGTASRGERGSGQVGDVVADVVLAVGQQVEPRVGDVREQGRGPAAAVEAQDRLRGGPAMPRSGGSRSRIWVAREDEGWAITTSSGSPALSVTQVSSVAGPGNFSLARCIFWMSLLPK